MDAITKFRAHAQTLMSMKRRALATNKYFSPIRAAPKTLENAQHIFNLEVNKEARAYLIAARFLQGLKYERVDA